MTRAICVLACVLAAAAGAQPSLAVRGVQLVDIEAAEVRPDTTILIRLEYIDQVGATADVAVDADAVVIDGSGLYAIPGLWDMHVHLANDPDHPDQAHRLLPLLLAYGVVGVRDMGGNWEVITRLRPAIASGALAAPDIVAVGPFVNGTSGNYTLPVESVAEADEAVSELMLLGIDYLKIQANLRPDVYEAVVTAARSRGLGVIGHVPDGVSARAVVESGQSTIEHISPALPGDAALMFAASSEEERLRAELLALNADTASPAADRDLLRARRRQLQSDLMDSFDPERAASLFAALTQAGVAVTPTLVWSESILPTSAADVVPEGYPVRFFDSGDVSVWKEARARYVEALSEERIAHNTRIKERSAAFVGALHEAGVTILAGTDSISAFVLPGDSLHRELELLVGAGLSTADALRAATSAATRALDLDMELGRIRRGQRADIVLLSGNPLDDISATRSIQAVIKAGRHYGRAELDRLLDEAVPRP